jgi:NCAIR mutase (PurE)-related protein
MERGLRELLESVRNGDVAVEDALESLRYLPFEDIGFAKVDHHRKMRCGLEEVIYCEGKTPEHVGRIAGRILGNGDVLLATRADPRHFEAIKNMYAQAEYREEARCVVVEKKPAEKSGYIVVVTAGTTDIPVASEAVVTAEVMGAKVDLITDVGVSGIHRLLGYARTLQKANAVVVVAGMEGALPSVVGGLVSCPVIGVPTSVGYGTSFHGVAPLLTMLNSCAAGVTVVNIDNGFGAGYTAAMINALAVRKGNNVSGE